MYKITVTYSVVNRNFFLFVSPLFSVFSAVNKTFFLLTLVVLLLVFYYHFYFFIFFLYFTTAIDNTNPHSHSHSSFIYNTYYRIRILFVFGRWCKTLRKIVGFFCFFCFLIEILGGIEEDMFVAYGIGLYYDEFILNFK